MTTFLVSLSLERFVLIKKDLLLSVSPTKFSKVFLRNSLKNVEITSCLREFKTGQCQFIFKENVFYIFFSPIKRKIKEKINFFEFIF